MIDTSFWCERVRICFSMFLKDPSTLNHLLLFGPPGSGKTTSAAWLVEQIWGSKKSLMSISMNAADERSLESIRQKVFPFVRVDWRSETEKAPKFLILDECETLTEAAQLSLQTILNHDPRDICVILICNSQSRIHPKLRQRLLKIRYDPPNRGADTDIFTAITRGDMRFLNRKHDIEKNIWNYIHCHPDTIINVIQEETIDYQTILSDILLLSEQLSILDDNILEKINTIYPLITDASIHYDYVNGYITDIIKTFRKKFDSLTELKRV